jgi:hypothetical protein
MRKIAVVVEQDLAKRIKASKKKPAKKKSAPANREAHAKALCGDDNDPASCEQTAQNELVLRAIIAQQLAVVERLCKPSTIAWAKGDNSLELIKARILERDLPYE